MKSGKGHEILLTPFKYYFSMLQSFCEKIIHCADIFLDKESYCIFVINSND